VQPHFTANCVKEVWVHTQNDMHYSFSKMKIDNIYAPRVPQEVGHVLSGCDAGVNRPARNWSE